MGLGDILKILRVKQWVKNSFVFFPLLFSGQAVSTFSLKASILAFGAYCLIASSVYIFNDLLDYDKDRLHPKKNKRVLIHNQSQKFFVIGLMFALLALGLNLSSRVNELVVLSTAFYVVVNLVYNLVTKHVVILDVIFIATGFYLRILTGSFAIGVYPSVWLQMCVFLLALFLGFTKRRHEMITLKDKAHEHRSVLAHYTAYLLDQMIIICSTLAIVFYGLYTMSPEMVARIGGYKMVYSVTFVIYGMFRYLYLVHVKKLGDDPGEILLSDVPLLVCILGWIGYVAMIIYAR